MSNILPYNQTTVNTITRFSVMVTSVVLFTSANLLVTNYDANNEFVNVVNLTISGNDYTQWNDDDNYIITYVANKLGYTLANNV